MTRYHRYQSTACFHGDHDYCRCDTALTGQPKRPGQCKFCDALCICPCHRPTAATGVEPGPT